jgi:hypothetical protein
MAKANLKLVQTAYPIEKGVPLPARIYPTGGRPAKFPWARMKVGDSFVMDKPQKQSGSVARQYGKAHGVKYATRKIDANTTRIWRIK